MFHEKQVKIIIIFIKVDLKHGNYRMIESETLGANKCSAIVISSARVTGYSAADYHF